MSESDSDETCGVERLYHQAFELSRSGRHEDAMQVYVEAFSIRRETHICRRIRELALLLDQRDLADEMLETAYSINPRNDRCAFEYATLLAQRGRDQEAIRMLREIVSRNRTFRPAIDRLREITSNMSDETPTS